ncbi:MAG TPA: diacylglycerol kinase family protein [Microbacteriaceae bacterium]|nr:diacylglycerol kinase family protein [Microbacteriaceae bacterium]
MGDADPAEVRFAAVVANPVKVNIERLRAAVERSSREHGWAAPVWRETTVSDPGARAAREALSTGAALIITAGGDGTVRAVAGIVRGTGVPLAIVPAGTGNLLARGLNLPLNSIEKAVALAFTGEPRSVDVGVVRALPERASQSAHEHVFVVMAGMGVDATLLANTRSSLKKRVGWLAYVDGGMRSLVTLKPMHLRFAVDGGTPHGARISTILVANSGRLPGGIDLFPDAAVDDGLLDVAVLQPRSIFGWLLVWRRVTWENRVLRRSALGRSLIRFTGALLHVTRPGRRRTVTYLAGKEVTVTSREPQPFEVDGDPAGIARELHFRVEPGALVIKTPRRLR